METDQSASVPTSTQTHPGSALGNHVWAWGVHNEHITTINITYLIQLRALLWHQLVFSNMNVFKDDEES